MRGCFMKDDKANMVDILDSMKLAMTYLGSMTLNDFEKTIEKVAAICRRLESSEKQRNDFR
jgi:uncharacterized protein with HEPN domain